MDHLASTSYNFIQHATTKISGEANRNLQVLDDLQKGQQAVHEHSGACGAQGYMGGWGGMTQMQ